MANPTNPSNPKMMMVLADGETYSELKGCTIVALDMETIDKWQLNEDEVVKFLLQDEFWIDSISVNNDGRTKVMQRTALKVEDLAQVITRFS